MDAELNFISSYLDNTKSAEINIEWNSIRLMHFWNSLVVQEADTSVVAPPRQEFMLVGDARNSIPAKLIRRCLHLNCNTIYHSINKRKENAPCLPIAS